jgi:ribosomal protein S18 acetylase RimI-like enzyme
VTNYRVERLYGSQITPNDLEDLSKIYAEYDRGVTLTERDLRSFGAEHALFVVREDVTSRITGFLTLIPYPRMKGRVAQVEDIVVLEAYRRRGRGKALMRQALQHAKACGCVDMHLSTYPDMHAANGLYESLGGNRREMNVYKWLIA